MFLLGMCGWVVSWLMLFLSMFMSFVMDKGGFMFCRTKLIHVHFCTLEKAEKENVFNVFGLWVLGLGYSLKCGLNLRVSFGHEEGLNVG